MAKTETALELLGEVKETLADYRAKLEALLRDKCALCDASGWHPCDAVRECVDAVCLSSDLEGENGNDF
jgi:hypothetical protein